MPDQHWEVGMPGTSAATQTHGRAMTGHGTPDPQHSSEFSGGESRWHHTPGPAGFLGVSAHESLTSMAPFRVRFSFHCVLRVPLPTPDDPEIGITTTTAGDHW